MSVDFNLTDAEWESFEYYQKFIKERSESYKLLSEESRNVFKNNIKYEDQPELVKSACLELSSKLSTLILRMDNSDTYGNILLKMKIAKEKGIVQTPINLVSASWYCWCNLSSEQKECVLENNFKLNPQKAKETIDVWATYVVHETVKMGLFKKEEMDVKIKELSGARFQQFKNSYCIKDE
jgi:hypothetical protein